MADRTTSIRCETPYVCGDLDEGETPCEPCREAIAQQVAAAEHRAMQLRVLGPSSEESLAATPEDAWPARKPQCRGLCDLCNGVECQTTVVDETATRPIKRVLSNHERSPIADRCSCGWVGQAEPRFTGDAWPARHRVHVAEAILSLTGTLPIPPDQAEQVETQAREAIQGVLDNDYLMRQDDRVADIIVATLANAGLLVQHYPPDPQREGAGQ